MAGGGDSAPNVDAAWALLVSQVPQEWRPFLGVVAASAILAWLLLNAIKLVLEIVKTLRDLRRRAERRAEPPAELRPPPQPRVNVWNAAVGNRPVSNSPVPIVTVANMKGGVGKTTLTANLAAHFDAHGKRVLLIDLDYQGSLSQTVLAAANNDRLGSVVDELVRGEKSMGAILEESQSLTPALPKSRILTCYYEFSDTETNEMVNWIVASRDGREVQDLRFRLSRLLRDPVVATNYDLVLIDAPPRFSTGTINALCASTHVIIPTVLDQMSAEAVVYFSRDAAAMRQSLFPALKLVGVVPTLTWRERQYSPSEIGTIDRINEAIRPYWGVKDAVLSAANVPRTNNIGDVSGQGIGYVDAGQSSRTAKVREIFDRVGEAISARIWV